MFFVALWFGSVGFDYIRYVEVYRYVIVIIIFSFMFLVYYFAYG